jgi:MFS family permease
LSPGQALRSGFIGGVITLPAFSKDFNLVKKSAAEQTAFASNVVSVFQAGAVFGALISASFADRFGRRLCLLANLIIYIVGAALMTAASGTAGIGLVYAGRVLTGWAVGASTMIVPVYVAECSPPHIRGRLVGLYEVGVQFGTMVSISVLPIRHRLLTAI